MVWSYSIYPKTQSQSVLPFHQSRRFLNCIPLWNLPLKYAFNGLIGWFWRRSSRVKLKHRTIKFSSKNKQIWWWRVTLSTRVTFLWRSQMLRVISLLVKTFIFTWIMHLDDLQMENNNQNSSFLCHTRNNNQFQLIFICWKAKGRSNRTSPHDSFPLDSWYVSLIPYRNLTERRLIEKFNLIFDSTLQYPLTALLISFHQ